MFFLLAANVMFLVIEQKMNEGPKICQKYAQIGFKSVPTGYGELCRQQKDITLKPFLCDSGDLKTDIFAKNSKS